MFDLEEYSLLLWALFSFLVELIIALVISGPESENSPVQNGLVSLSFSVLDHLLHEVTTRAHYGSRGVKMWLRA